MLIPDDWLLAGLGTPSVARAHSKDKAVYLAIHLPPGYRGTCNWARKFL